MARFAHRDHIIIRDEDAGTCLIVPRVRDETGQPADGEVIGVADDVDAARKTIDELVGAADGED